MPSQVWTRNFNETYLYRFDFDAQEEFVREASRALDEFSDRLGRYHLTFSRDDKSVNKAVWMLQMDALGALRDSLDALSGRRHRVAAALFRIVQETLALAAYFHGRSDQAMTDLSKWYDDEVVLHNQYRKWIGREQGSEAAEDKKQDHRDLSKFTHRTYQALLHGYQDGPDKKLAHVQYISPKPIITIDTLAVYFFVLRTLIQGFASELGACGLVDVNEIDESWGRIFEEGTTT